MLTHVDMVGFRGIRSGAIGDLRALTVLTGGNASGKTTVLDALFVAAHPDPAAALTALLAGARVAGAERFLPPARDPDTTIKLRGKTEGGARAIAMVVREGRVDLQVRGAEASATGAVSLTGEDPSVTWKTAPPPLLPSVTRVIPAGDLARAWSDATLAGRSAAVIERVRGVAPGLQDLQMILDDAGDPILYALTRDADLPLELMGAGVVAFTRLALALLAAPKGLLLVDEPARHAHPATTWAIGRLLWDCVAEGNQLVVTTQNLDLVDGIVATATRSQNETISLRRLVLQDGRLGVGAMDGDDVAFARNVAEDDLR